jgi:hypothetical protein
MISNEIKARARQTMLLKGCTEIYHKEKRKEAMSLKEKVFFNHFRGENLEKFFEIDKKLRLVEVPKGCVAITSCTIVDGNDENPRTGFAFCDQHDHFCKKVGRNIAETRARSAKYINANEFSSVPLMILSRPEIVGTPI